MAMLIQPGCDPSNATTTNIKSSATMSNRSTSQLEITPSVYESGTEPGCSIEKTVVSCDGSLFTFHAAAGGSPLALETTRSIATQLIQRAKDGKDLKFEHTPEKKVEGESYPIKVEGRRGQGQLPQVGHPSQA